MSVYPKPFSYDILDATTIGKQLVTAASKVLARSYIDAGDTVGPSSSTDNAIVRFDSTTGKLIQNSAVTVSDAGAILQAATSNATLWHSFTPNNSVNPAATISCSEAVNADGVSYDFVQTWGHNTQAGGSRIDTTKGQQIIHLESDYRATATGQQTQEGHWSFQAPGVVRTANRVFGIYSENDATNPLYGINLQSSIDVRSYLYTDIRGVNAGTQWTNQTPSGINYYDRVNNTTFGQQTDGSGITFSLAAITGGGARDYTYALGTNAKFKISSFIINPTAATIDFGGYKPGLIRSTSSIQAEGSFYAALGAPLYFANPSDVIQVQGSVDSSNNFLFRKTTTGGGDIYNGFSSGTSTGNYIIQTKGVNIVQVLPTGEVKINPDQSASASGRIASIRASASQAFPVLGIYNPAGTEVSGFSKNGYPMNMNNTIPADAELAAGQMMIWFDSTNGAAKLMVKSKEAGGTVRTGSLALA